MRKQTQAPLAVALAALGVLIMTGASARQPAPIMGQTSVLVAADGHGNDGNGNDDHGNDGNGNNGNGNNGQGDDHRGQSSDAHNCTNPAGHERGQCNQNGRNRQTTISGTILNINGNALQVRLDNGSIVTVNDRNLQRNGNYFSVGQHYSFTGHYSNNVFIAQNTNSNNYGGNNNSNANVRGIITSVNGSTVTILQGLSSITINDQNAINNGQANNLYVTRSITAYGYWNGNVFYASSIQ